MSKPKATQDKLDASASSGEESEDLTPSDDSIRKAFTDLAKEMDMEETTMKKLKRSLARRLGVSVDDLQPQKSLIKKCMNEEIRKRKQEKKLPSEAEIQAAARELSSRLNMEAVSFRKFNRLLCDDLQVEDLTPAKSIINKVFNEALQKATPAPRNQVTPDTDQDTSSNTASMTQSSAMEAPRPHQRSSIPVEVTKTPRRSTDLEHGRNIPEAAQLTWKDDFFDDHDMAEDLVAVFDHVRARIKELAVPCCRSC